jgi:hypothetical protein
MSEAQKRCAALRKSISRGAKLLKELCDYLISEAPGSKPARRAGRLPSAILGELVEEVLAAGQLLEEEEAPT